MILVLKKGDTVNLFLIPNVTEMAEHRKNNSVKVGLYFFFLNSCDIKDITYTFSALKMSKNDETFVLYFAESCT